MTDTAVPTEVFVIVMKDRDGNPRGVEKVSNERFYMIEGEAWDVHDKIEDPVIKWGTTVRPAEIVIR